MSRRRWRGAVGSFQFSDPLHNLRRRRLRRDVAVERDFSLDLFDVLGDIGLAVIFRMDDLRNNTCKRILVWHKRIVTQRGDDRSKNDGNNNRPGIVPRWVCVAAAITSAHRPARPFNELLVLC